MAIERTSHWQNWSMNMNLRIIKFSLKAPGFTKHNAKLMNKRSTLYYVKKQK